MLFVAGDDVIGAGRFRTLLLRRLVSSAGSDQASTSGGSKSRRVVENRDVTAAWIARRLSAIRLQPFDEPSDRLAVRADAVGQRLE